MNMYKYTYLFILSIIQTNNYKFLEWLYETNILKLTNNNKDYD